MHGIYYIVHTYLLQLYCSIKCYIIFPRLGQRIERDLIRLYIFDVTCTTSPIRDDIIMYYILYRTASRH